jgi:hypothetical protein
VKTKTVSITTLFILLLNLVLIYLVDLFTFEMTPGRAISGNGNPALVLWFFEIPAYVLLLFGLFYLVKQTKYFVHKTAIFPIVYFLLLCLSVYLQYNHVLKINRSIDQLIDEYGAINQYTNTIYINCYTFLIGIFALLTLQSIVQRMKQ